MVKKSNAKKIIRGQSSKVKEAEKILIEEQKKKVNACFKEVRAVLDKHGFDLDVVKPQFVLIPKK